MAKENFPYQLFIVGEEYSRNDINKRLTNSVVSQQSGVSSFNNGLVLFVTLEKKGRKEDIQYKDFFRGKKEFFWESQTPNSPYGTPQKPLISKLLKGEITSYLYVRIEEKTKSKTNPFIYCGSLEVESYDDQANNERPFGVKFLCRDMPDNLNSNLQALIEWVPKHYSTNFSFSEVINLASSFLANDKVKIKKFLDNSLMLVTALAPHIGYDNSAKIAKKALKNNTTLKEEALRSGLINEKDYDFIVDPKKMIYPK